MENALRTKTTPLLFCLERSMYIFMYLCFYLGIFIMGNLYWIRHSIVILIVGGSNQLIAFFPSEVVKIKLYLSNTTLIKLNHFENYFFGGRFFFNPIQDSPFWAAHGCRGRGGARDKKTPSLKSVTHILQ